MVGGAEAARRWRLTAESQRPQALKAALVQRFAEALEREAPPHGLPDGFAESGAEAAPSPEASDLYGFYPIWSALTALVQETKLQGRAFGQLKDALEAERPAPAAPELAEELALLRSSLAQQSELEKTLIEALLDTRDRLHRGLETGAALQQQSDRPTSWWRRLFGASEEQVQQLHEANRAQHQAQAIILERLDAQLGRVGICALDAQAQPFDPHRMNAVDVEFTDAVPAGQVVEVYSPGYLRGEEVLRVARVKVARQKWVND
ncbi:MAG: nucleotide exchange factor GrpE [Deltaproteobacteria bacterium CG_4_9_14_3_um_filter_63_12]|nr:MAG: nucleotide exchange factor GrpE [Deltaproteobacteria bacterium CG17_big_fil_post_rev_8_21_14_2_50_63_7]PJB36080.1 MAG: nucleotide exchange factor GrpE [Deltaproteobacteria bacterium CG_4_9_14_3_um_filter_63_12]